MRGEREPTSEGIRTSKAIIFLSLLLPYLVDWLNTSEITHIAIYAPVWVLVSSPDYFFVGPTPMALLLFFYWTPYLLVGYQTHRFAIGRCSTTKRYVTGILVLTAIAVVFALPMMMTPRAQVGEDPLYFLVIPLPLVSLIAVLLIPLLRPRVLRTPWTGLAANADSRLPEDAMSEDECESEVAQKVVAIMQTIAEDTDDRRKKAWRKMLGISDTSEEPASKEDDSDS